MTVTSTFWLITKAGELKGLKLLELMNGFTFHMLNILSTKNSKESLKYWLKNLEGNFRKIMIG